MSVGRVMLIILMAAAGAVALYGVLIDTSPTRLPLTVAGLFVGGVAAGLFGFSLAGTAVRQGQRGYGGRALGAAFLGGLFVMGACGALAGAIVLGILTGGF